MVWNLPISIKGIVLNSKDEIILLKNERNEWELPGGRIEEGEKPEETLMREIYEELGIYCTAEKLIDVWIYEVLPSKHIFIVTYLCTIYNLQNITISSEHIDYQWFTIYELEKINIPEGYKISIRKLMDNTF